MIEAPCRNCTDRYLGCHDRCPKYQKYKKFKNAENRAYQEEALYTFSPSRIRRHEKWLKKS